MCIAFSLVKENKPNIIVAIFVAHSSWILADKINQ